MGVQAEAGRERRVGAQQPGHTSPQPSHASQPAVKRFKPSPVHETDGTAGLKIRLSRYSAAPGRAQTKPGSGPASPAPLEPADAAAGPGRVTRGRSQETPAATPASPADTKAGVKSCEVRLSALDTRELGASEQKPHPPPRVEYTMTASEIVAECERAGPGTGPISTSLQPDGTPTPMPKRRHELPKLTPDQLLPPTSSVHVKTKQEAFSPQLLDWCLQRPITVIRGLAQACDIDLGLYTTKTLVEMNPHHPVEVRSQLEQSSDENLEPSLKEQVWYCTSSRSHTTVSKYAEYLATSFKEAKERLGDDFSVNPKLNLKNDPETGLPVRRTIKFGTNCDLSDEKKWKPQIQELMKLPCWLRVVSAANQLSHIGHQILGMNTIQLYLKVPCSRTPGHQENNNFAAVNINIGPGDSEWFGVPDQYWGALQELCEKNNVDYLHGSWWPKMSDLREAGIPCYRFMQRPGELVWVNTGCVHWVQAAGWCNNVAWNTGPLTHRQYQAAIERYEWNKTQRYQSIVAMEFLTWNMAQNIRVSDPALFRALKTTMLRSITKSVLMKQYALENNIPVRFHGHRPNEPVNYCMVCEEEVFNIFFVKEAEKKHVVHCLRCARLQNPKLTGWICLEEYVIDHLKTIFDNFSMGDSSLRPTLENPCRLAVVNNNVKTDIKIEQS